MKIIDLNGERVEACLQFKYLDYMISASTIMDKHGNIAIFDPSGDDVSEEFIASIPHAMGIIEADIRDRRS